MKNIRTNLHDLEKKLNRKLNILIMYFDRNTLVNHRDNSFPTRGHFKHPIENFIDVGKSQIVECLEDWLDVRKTFNSSSSRTGSIIRSSLTKSLRFSKISTGRMHLLNITENLTILQNMR